MIKEFLKLNNRIQFRLSSRRKETKRLEQYLKPGVTFEILGKIVDEKSVNEFAALMQKVKEELFNNFTRRKLQFPTIYTTFISSSYVD